MTYLDAFLLGLIQGITEFLPVSSSGHLVLYSMITGAQSSLYFDLILHLGSLAAVVIVYFKDIAELIKHPLSKRARMLMLSTAISAIVVFLLKDIVDSTFDGAFLPLFFLITAVILALGAYFPKKPKIKEIGALDAVIIGAAQGFAAFPGLSRSGLTASTGSLLGVEKSQNASFCFILSIPIIIGSAIVETIGGTFDPVPFGCLAVGFAAAFFSGLLALKLIKKVFLNNRFDIFAAYLVVLSLFLTANNLWLHLF